MASAAQRADWIAYHAVERPDAEACIDLASGRSLTYAQLDGRVARLAHHLKDVLGLPPGSRVMVLARNDSDIFEIQFACLRAGLVFVPVNWRLAPDEIAYIAADCAPDICFHGHDLATPSDRLRQASAVRRFVEMRNGAKSAYEAIMAESAPDPGRTRRAESDCCALIYTSGTTGRPKGARISYRMLLTNAVVLGGAFDVDASSRNLVVLPLFHTGGLNVFANPVFFWGGCNIVARRYEAQSLLSVLADPKLAVSHFMAVPTIFDELAEHDAFAALRNGGLQALGVAGSPCPAATLKAYRAIGLDLRQAWGMTEAGPFFLISPRDCPSDKLSSCGRPNIFAEAKIVGPGGDLVRGEIGELVVRGPGVTDGYWKREAESADVFTGDGWFRTGDAAFVDDEGFHHIVDRWKDMYVSGGENVYPAEVERVLERHRAVRECAVVGMADARWGEVGCAFVVPEPGQSPREDDLRAHCATYLARFKVPKRFVFTDGLPRNASGKLLKPNLRRRIAEAATPSPTRSDTRSARQP